LLPPAPAVNNFATIFYSIDTSSSIKSTMISETSMLPLTSPPTRSHRPSGVDALSNDSSEEEVTSTLSVITKTEPHLWFPTTIAVAPGSKSADGPMLTTSGAPTTLSKVIVPNNGDPFSSGGHHGYQDDTQKSTTAGLVSGVVAAGAMYGLVIFVIARRCKRKKQARWQKSVLSTR
jgi:hypothetical protein